MIVRSLSELLGRLFAGKAPALAFILAFFYCLPSATAQAPAPPAAPAVPVVTSWPQAIVALVVMLLPIAWAIVNLLKARQANAHANLLAQAIEQSGAAAKPVKATASRMAAARGITDELDARIESATGRAPSSSGQTGAVHHLLLLAAALTALLVGLAGCAVPPEVPPLVQTQLVVAAGHVRDPRHELPLQAREIAQDDYDAWEQVAKSLGVTIPDTAALTSAERVR